MLVRLTIGRTPGTVSLTETALTVGQGDDRVVAWDRGGRLYSVADESRTCRRALNGRVLMKWRSAGSRQRAWATAEEGDAVVDDAAALAAQVLHAVGASNAAGTAPADLLVALARASAFDATAARADAARFEHVYQPIGILPPDQYLALVLQATEGCSFRSCTFCEFYRNPYRVRSAAEFRDHVHHVLQYLGDSASLRRRTIFFGSANALAVPMSGLMPLFEVVADQFPSRPVHAFVDGFTGTLKTAADYRRLAARGLRRVYVGLESGHDPLLALVNKPASSAQAVATVQALKASGIAVGVIVMTGLGGDRFSDAHVRDTARVVTDMGLDERDLLYFSELVDEPDSAYGTSMREHGVRPLDSRECAAQRRAIEERLGFAGEAPKRATYDISEFVY